MATLIHPTTDQHVALFKRALDHYEKEHPGSAASLYGGGEDMVRIRIIDPAFAPLTKWQRHEALFDYLSSEVGETPIHHLGVLLLLAPHEVKNSETSRDFDLPAVTPER